MLIEQIDALISKSTKSTFKEDVLYLDA